jgi:hypothetical protein
VPPFFARGAVVKELIAANLFCWVAWRKKIKKGGHLWLRMLLPGIMPEEVLFGAEVRLLIPNLICGLNVIQAQDNLWIISKAESLSRV